MTTKAGIETLHALYEEYAYQEKVVKGHLTCATEAEFASVLKFSVHHVYPQLIKIKLENEYEDNSLRD